MRIDGIKKSDIKKFSRIVQELKAHIEHIREYCPEVDLYLLDCDSLALSTDQIEDWDDSSHKFTYAYAEDISISSINDVGARQSKAGEKHEIDCMYRKKSNREKSYNKYKRAEQEDVTSLLDKIRLMKEKEKDKS